MPAPRVYLTSWWPISVMRASLTVTPAFHATGTERPGLRVVPQINASMKNLANANLTVTPGFFATSVAASLKVTPTFSATMRVFVTNNPQQVNVAVSRASIR